MAVRSNGIRLRKSNLVVRNLVVQHVANKIVRNEGEAAIYWSKNDWYQWCESNARRNVVIEHVESRRNNGDGISLSGHIDNTMRHCSSHHNGGNGGSGSYVANSLWEDVSFTDNNWRISGYGGKTTWFVAGFKMGWCSKNSVFRNITVENHPSAGFWFDGNSFGNVLKNVVARNNEKGIFIEISEGPTLIKECLLENNREAGVIIVESRHVTVRDCRVKDNEHAGVKLVVKNGPREVSVAGEYVGPNVVRNADGKMILTTEDVRLFCNVVTTTRGAESYLITPGFRWGGDDAYNRLVLDQLQADSNAYYNPDNERVFYVNRPIVVDFDGWKARLTAESTGQTSDQETYSVWHTPQDITRAGAHPVDRKSAPGAMSHNNQSAFGSWEAPVTIFDLRGAALRRSNQHGTMSGAAAAGVSIVRVGFRSDRSAVQLRLSHLPKSR